MSSINVLNIIVQNPVSYFKETLKFEIVFECLSELKNGKIIFNLDIEWKLIYVGSAEDESHGQVLDSVLIGPLQIGSMKFDFEANPPDFTKIPHKDLIGVTAILLTCSYNSQEFFRVGYYVNVTYDNEEMNLSPPDLIEIDRVVKNILSDKPRITKFTIEWDCSVSAIPSFNNFIDENIQQNISNENQLLNENSNHMANLNNRMGLFNNMENFGNSNFNDQFFNNTGYNNGINNENLKLLNQKNQNFNI